MSMYGLVLEILKKAGAKGSLVTPVKFETLGRISLHFSYSRALYTLAVYFLLCVGALALSLLSVYALVTSIGLTGYT